MTNNPGYTRTRRFAPALRRMRVIPGRLLPFGLRHPTIRNATIVYQLPFGPSRLVHMNRAIDEAVGGWRVSGDAILYSASLKMSPARITPI